MQGSILQISNNTMPLVSLLRTARTAAPVRGWETAFRFAFDPDKQHKHQFLRQLFEGYYIGNAAHFVDWYMLFYGAYEPNDVLAMRRILKQMDRPTVLDVGANSGHHCVALGGLCDVVHAFEPCAAVWPALQTNVTLNSVMNILVHRIGLGAANETLRFAPPSANNLGVGRIAPNGSDSIQVRIGDDYLDEIGCKKVDLIKVDVEGHEVEVLRGLRQTIQRDKPVIVVEANQGPDSLRRLLPPSYELYNATKNSLTPANNIPGENVFCISTSRQQSNSSRCI